MKQTNTSTTRYKVKRYNDFTSVLHVSTATRELISTLKKGHDKKGHEASETMHNLQARASKYADP